MSAQVLYLPGPGELHSIVSQLSEDVTSVRCTEAGCGFGEDSGTGLTPGALHAADHAMVTGHSVVERHVVVTVIREGT